MPASIAISSACSDADDPLRSSSVTGVATISTHPVLPQDSIRGCVRSQTTRRSEATYALIDSL